MARAILVATVALALVAGVFAIPTFYVPPPEIIAAQGAEAGLSAEASLSIWGCASFEQLFIKAFLFIKSNKTLSKANQV
jgi:hypothetical protein